MIFALGMLGSKLRIENCELTFLLHSAFYILHSTFSAPPSSQKTAPPPPAAARPRASTPLAARYSRLAAYLAAALERAPDSESSGRSPHRSPGDREGRYSAAAQSSPDPALPHRSRPYRHIAPMVRQSASVP